MGDVVIRHYPFEVPTGEQTVAQAELIEKFLDQTFEIVDIEFGFALATAPK